MEPSRSPEAAAVRRMASWTRSLGMGTLIFAPAALLNRRSRCVWRRYMRPLTSVHVSKTPCPALLHAQSSCTHRLSLSLAHTQTDTSMHQVIIDRHTCQCGVRGNCITERRVEGLYVSWVWCPLPAFSFRNTKITSCFKSKDYRCLRKRLQIVRKDAGWHDARSTGKNQHL